MRGRTRREEESWTREEEEAAGVAEWRREKVVGAAAEAIAEKVFGESTRLNSSHQDRTRMPSSA